MRWITNCEDGIAVTKRLADFYCGWSGRVLVVGEPRATKARTTEALTQMGVVGIYETAAGSPI